jgi:hypothetical protein
MLKFLQGYLFGALCFTMLIVLYVYRTGGL